MRNTHELCFDAQSNLLEVNTEAIYLLLLVKLKFQDEDEFGDAYFSKIWTADTNFANIPSATIEINNEKALSHAPLTSANSRDLVRRCFKNSKEHYAEMSASPDYLIAIVANLFLGKACLE